MVSTVNTLAHRSRIRVTGLPVKIDSGVTQFVPPPPEFLHDKSVDLGAATTDKFSTQTTEVNIGTSNTWTYMVWYKPQDSDTFGLIHDLRNSSDNNNTVRFLLGASQRWDVQLWNSAGSNFKDYRLSSALVNDVWTQLIATWDGTTLKMYLNGSLASPTLTTDSAGTVSSDDRLFSVGGAGGSGTTFCSNGRYHSVAHWTSVLTASEITSVYNGGNGSIFNLAANSGNYASAANIIHWWQFGKNSSDIGKDYVGSIDLMSGAVGIVSGDIVSDYPGI